jgi:hypothetical protein
MSSLDKIETIAVVGAIGVAAYFIYKTFKDSPLSTAAGAAGGALTNITTGATSIILPASQLAKDTGKLGGQILTSADNTIKKATDVVSGFDMFGGNNYGDRIDKYVDQKGGYRYIVDKYLNVDYNYVTPQGPAKVQFSKDVQVINPYTGGIIKANPILVGGQTVGYDTGKFSIPAPRVSPSTSSKSTSSAKWNPIVSVKTVASKTGVVSPSMFNTNLGSASYIRRL